MLIEVAGTGGAIEDGAGFGVTDTFVGLIREEQGFFVVLAEDACGLVARKEWGDASKGFGYACDDAICAWGVVLS
jgi:hypothetical protein